MEYFHPETKSLLQHPECSCCGIAHQNKIGGMLAVYDTSKDPRSEIRTYFPYLHLVCSACYPKYENLWMTRVANPRQDYSKTELVNEICQRAPQWSMIWTTFHYTHRPFEYIRFQAEFPTVKSILALSAEKTLPYAIMCRIYDFAKMPNLIGFAYEVNGQADIEFWNENVLDSDWQEPSYDGVLV